MLNVLASEIEDIINLTGNVSLPQIAVTIANVILLAVNIILAIIKKIKNVKNNKKNQEVETSAELVALNKNTELNAELVALNKNKELNEDMERLVKFKAVISKEKFENEYETVSVMEGTDIGAVLNNAVIDIPTVDPDAETVKNVLSPIYIDAIADCYANTGNSKVFTGIDAILGAFNYKLSITVEKEEEVITVAKREETIL